MATEQNVPKFFLFLMVAAGILLGLVIYPLARVLFLAAVLAGVLWPLRVWLTRKLGKRPGLAAGLLTGGVIVLVLGPLAAGVAFIIRDGDAGVRFVADTARSARVAGMIAELPAGAQDFLNDVIARLPEDMGDVAEQLGPQGGKAAAKVGRFGVSAAMMMIALFFFLRRGDDLVTWLDSVSPLHKGRTRELMQTFGRVSYAVVLSAIVTAAVQAVAALIGFLIARVPNPLFFTVVTFFTAFIPAVGAASVCLVAAALLVVTGHLPMGIFLAAWGIVVVGLVDNVIKPLLIKRGMEIHGGVVFFSLVGGLAAFGAIGLLVGPLAVAFFLALLRMYHRDYTPGDSRVPAVPGIRDKTT